MKNTFFLAAPIIIMCEFLVDWVKHCFASNFNRIPLEVYAKFSAVLRHDLTAGFEKRGGDRRGGGGGGQGTDARSNGTASVEGGAPAPVGNAPTRNHSYRVASRIGLVNLPLACVLVRQGGTCCSRSSKLARCPAEHGATASPDSVNHSQC